MNTRSLLTFQFTVLPTATGNLIGYDLRIWYQGNSIKIINLLLSNNYNINVHAYAHLYTIQLDSIHNTVILWLFSPSEVHSERTVFLV